MFFFFAEPKQYTEMSVKTINMGPNTHGVPVSMFKENRERVCAALLKHPGVSTESLVVLQGGDSLPLYNTDVDYVFRQVSPSLNIFRDYKELF